MMRLHANGSAFWAILLRLSERSGIRQDVLEKDYYVMLMLEELAAKQESLPAYFKGGTALYKALGMMQRFSEMRYRSCCRRRSRSRRSPGSKGPRSGSESGAIKPTRGLGASPTFP